MTDFVLSFDEIRPYYDHEVQEVFQRLIEKPSFFLMLGVLFPELSKDQIIADLAKIKRVEEFQAGYIYRTLDRILDMSSKGLSISGLEKLDPERPYLFLSNHRDIILDSAFLNFKLHENGFPTTRIAIGDNLMVSNLITDLMKINKAFIVHRSVPRQKLLAYSERLSRYIRHSITEEKSSIWLAQRSGRTKDGRDLTHPAILKMLQISGTEDKAGSFRQLNIVPMSISYEFEPCDYLKVEENYHNKHELPYEKDDKKAMLTGIRTPKGHIHLAIGDPIDTLLDEMPEIANKNEWLKELALRLDREIHSLYKLWPSNYLAHDLLHKTETHAAHYSGEYKAEFLDLMNKRLRGLEGNAKELSDMFLQIYAGMVESREVAKG